MPNLKANQLIDKHKPKIHYARSAKVQVPKVRQAHTITGTDGEEYPARQYEWIISNDSVDSYLSFMDPLTTLPNFARDAKRGVPIQKNHDYSELQLGRSTGGRFDAKTNQVYADGYILEGLDDIGSDDVIKRLETDTARWVSVGFRGDYKCSICDSKMSWFWGDCNNGHVIGTEVHFDEKGYETDDLKKSVRTETVYEKIVDGELLEFSPVWRGATPDAELIKTVRSLYADKEIDDKHVENACRHLNCDVRTLLDKQPIRLRSNPMSKPLDPTELEGLEAEALITKLEEAHEQIRVLETEKETLLTQEQHDDKVQELSEQVVESQREVTELQDKIAEQSDLTEDVEGAVIELRKMALDAFARSAQLKKYAREEDDAYMNFKRVIDSIDSPTKLIHKIRVYDTITSADEGRKTYTDNDNDNDNEKPMPFGFPTQRAYGLQ